MNYKLEVIFELFLKYKNIFQMPEVNKKLVAMSKSLKRMRKLISSREQAPLYVVTIPTEMAFLESLDLVGACRQMETDVTGVFINLATKAGDCGTCGRLADVEKAMIQRYADAFGPIPQSVIFRDGDLRGPDTLEALGQSIFEWPAPDRLAEVRP